MATVKGQKRGQLAFTRLMKKAQQQSGLTSQQAEALAQEAVDVIRGQKCK